MSAAPIMWGTVPVPYTAIWSGENPPPHFEVRRVPGLGNEPFLIEGVNRPGDGKPNFSTFHVGRAIEVLVERKCQICLAPFGRDRQPYCLGHADVTFHGMPHITDGLPVCEACLRLTLRHCPGLAKWGDRLRIYAVRGYVLAPSVLGVMPGATGTSEKINAALINWRGKRPVYGTPKICLSSFITVPRGTMQ